MRVKQISVFLENKAGRLARVTKVLGENDINIRALAIADTTDFGILRLIVSDPDRAASVLRSEGFSVSGTDVIAVEVPDRPGGLANVMKVLDEKGINIEYLYAFVEKAADDAVVIFRVEAIDDAVSALEQAQVRVLPSDRVYSM